VKRAARRGAALRTAYAGAALLAVAAATAALAPADYLDPYGLPSGTATLKLIEQADIPAGLPVQGFDFASGTVDSLHSYDELTAAGEADLVFLAWAGDTLLRAPEDTEGFDRALIADLGDTVALAQIAHMEGVPLAVLVSAVLDHAYALLQIQTDAPIETTAVKLAVIARGDSTITFDWTWQPNGELRFVPVATDARSLGAIKRLYP
jgi:hypothetical protein